MSAEAVRLEWHRRPADRTKPWLVHVNTTSTGGGVAELLAAMISREAAGSHEVGWAVLSASPEFFAFTKNLHHVFHGRGDGEALRNSEANAIYRSTVAGPFDQFSAELQAGDTVVLHDAQTLGMVHALRGTGIRVVWHCHVGSLDDRNDGKKALWDFFERDLREVDVVASARPEYLNGAGVDDKLVSIRPAIDPSSSKNIDLTDEQINSLLRGMGLTDDAETHEESVRLWQSSPLPSDATVVVQVSRWDPLKDMTGVLRSIRGLDAGVHLVLAGPDPAEIPDDPEGLDQLNEVIAEFAGLPVDLASRVHLLALSMKDPEHNALQINALQRRADIVAQKSLQEGFGLTATEAMYKGKPVVASRVGGIEMQIEDGFNGVLVDPEDLDEFIASVNRLAADPVQRNELGRAARATVEADFLLPRMMADYRRNMMASPRGDEL